MSEYRMSALNFNSSSCYNLLLAGKRWILDIVRNTLLIFLAHKLPECVPEVILMHNFDSSMSPLTAWVFGSTIILPKLGKNRESLTQIEKLVVFAHILPSFWVTV